LQTDVSGGHCPESARIGVHLDQSLLAVEDMTVFLEDSTRQERLEADYQEWPDHEWIEFLKGND